MSVATVTLPANATYECRHATFIRASDPGQNLVGVIEIRESHHPVSKAKISRYALREVPGPNSGDRFKLTKPGGAEWYFVFLAYDLNWDCDRCECDGWHRNCACKHTLALRALSDAGHFAEFPTE